MYDARKKELIGHRICKFLFIIYYLFLFINLNHGEICKRLLEFNERSFCQMLNYVSAIHFI